MTEVNWNDIEVGQHYWFVPLDDGEKPEILRCARDPSALYGDKVLMDFALCVWTSSEIVGESVLYHISAPETGQ